MMFLNTAVWLYGSFARGDSDGLSDVDFLVIGENRDIPSDLLSALDAPVAQRGSMSKYSWNEIEGMSAYGSLFLHHIKAEGRPMFEGDSVVGKLKTYLDALVPYARANRDVRAFRAGLEESRWSLCNNGSIPFELSIIATLMRHSSILGCYLIGRPAFGRVLPVERFVSFLGMETNIAQEFSTLYSYKLFAEGRIREVPTQSLQFALEWCKKLDLILSNLEALLE
jgi:hypothetical protein